MTSSPETSFGAEAPAAGPLVEAILAILDDAKAEEIVSLDLAGKTSIADAMIIASGRSDRHVGAIAERIAFALKEMGLPTPRIEGATVGDWVLIDAGDIIVHLFRPEVRGFYNLEKLWGAGRPTESAPEEKPKVTRLKAADGAVAVKKPRAAAKPRVSAAKPRAAAGSRAPAKPRARTTRPRSPTE